MGVNLIILPGEFREAFHRGAGHVSKAWEDEKRFPCKRKAGEHTTGRERHTKRCLYDGIREFGLILQKHRSDAAEEGSGDHIAKASCDYAKKLVFDSQALGVLVEVQSLGEAWPFYQWGDRS